LEQLTPQQHELVGTLARRLGAVPGVAAVVLGGSHARGRARPDSDIDLGVLYSERDPFRVEAIRALAEELCATSAPVVVDFHAWGPWVDGGAWLTVAGQRVDFLYRGLEHLDRVIADAEAGRYQLDAAQQPPFGYFSATVLGEVATCIPLVDRGERLVPLKRRVARYPEALRRSVVQDFLWAAEFNLGAFAPKFAARADAFGTAACLARAVHALVLVLFAMNRRYLINDKTALAEVAELEQAPADFDRRVRRIFGGLGTTSGELARAVEEVRSLWRETVARAGDLYRPPFRLPG